MALFKSFHSVKATLSHVQSFTSTTSLTPSIIGLASSIYNISKWNEAMIALLIVNDPYM